MGNSAVKKNLDSEEKNIEFGAGAYIYPTGSQDHLICEPREEKLPSVAVPRLLIMATSASASRKGPRPSSLHVP